MYKDQNPIALVNFKSKIKLLEEINNYARNLNKNVKQVSITLAGNFQTIEIMKEQFNTFFDSRPLVRLNVNVSIEKNGKIENGSYGVGGRHMYDVLFDEKTWRNAVNNAYNQAKETSPVEENPI